MSWFTKDKPDRNVPLPTTATAVEDTLKTYILTKSRIISSSDDLDSQTPLFSSGLLDSLAFVDLVLFVEKTFQVKLARVTEINMDSLDSIAHIRDAVLKDVAAR